MSDYLIIGTCSLCGGQVGTPTVWLGVIPPVASCLRCGAVRANHGPIIQMQPAKTYADMSWDRDTSKYHIHRPANKLDTTPPGDE